MLDVIVMNAYHRGDWLIDRLAKTNLKIKVFDWSEKLGARSDSDMVGPFGFFESEKFNTDTQGWFSENFSLRLQKQGFTVLSEKGVVESQGPLRTLVSTAQKTLQENVFKNVISKVDKPVSLLNQEALPLAPTENFYTLKSRNHSVRGVTLLETDKIQVSMNSGKKELNHNGQVYSSSFLILFLNGYELMPFSEEGLTSLYPGEIPRPQLVWQKMKMKMETQAPLSQVPEHFISLQKSEDPWIEDNFVIFQKTNEEHKWDVWFKSWFDLHQQENYVHSILQKITEHLAKKFMQAQCLCAEKPQEIINPLSSSLYPIYDKKDWELQPAWYKDGVFFAGNEKLKNYLQSTQFAFQELVFKSLTEEKK